MANKAIGTLAVGSSVYLNVGGTRTEFLVVHQGKPSSMYDDSCNGTWLLAQDVYENRAWHSSNVNNYKNSAIHSYLNSTFLNLFDSNIREAIKQVKIPYVNGMGGSAVASGANGLPAKIFLLSGYEVGWMTFDSNSFPIDGACLSYFRETTSIDSKRIAYLNGLAAYWWLRSPNTGDTYYVWRVGNKGGYDAAAASTLQAIRPCIILPSTTLVDDSGNVVTVDLTAHKTLVGGTAYTVQGGKCMVDGTIYNILKGRTLIDGTAWDIAFPSAITMPVKGDLITMNLDGTDRQYRVLKIVDGTTVEVLGMESLITSIKLNSDGSNTYSGGELDTYFNTTWYSTLSSTAKAAIVPKTIAQDSWYWGTSGNPQYSGTRGNTAPGSISYTISKGNDNCATIGERYVYAMSIQEMLDYLSDSSVLVDTSGLLRNQNIWKMFWNQTSTVSKYPWLRSANAGDPTREWIVHGYFGYVENYLANTTYEARPAFQIDLSKIDFTIGGR